MPERVGVIDIGSNSIRLVVYRGTGRVPVSVFNEKVLCGLARGMAEAGSLDTEGTARALASLERFAALARAMGVGTLHTVATAAVREATDGAAFVARVAERCGLDVRVLSGAEEARLSALGVVADMPAADGVVGAHATLPLGSLRLAHGCSADPAGAAALIDRELGALGWLPALSGRTFYPVGGAWRALARLHVAQIGYPLEIIDQYSVKRARLAGMLGLVSQMSARSLAQLGQVPKRRIDTLPIASLVMQRLLRVGAPTGVSFSAHGLREGLLYSHLPAARRAEDPLIAACRATAGESGRFEPLGEALFDWTAPLFGGEDARGRRLRHAACLLSDLAWPDHPQYRAEQDLLRVLRAPVLSVDHRGRVFLALATFVRYGGNAEAPAADIARELLAEPQRNGAALLGHVLRLGYTLSGGVADTLAASRLVLEPGRVILRVEARARAVVSERVERRLAALAGRLDRSSAVEVAPAPAFNAAPGAPSAPRRKGRTARP